jgi:hypothetical protein
LASANLIHSCVDSRDKYRQNKISFFR